MPNGFRFETYDPRGSNIGALMMAPAQARARALREAGQAQARAAEIGGQATAGAINNIGSIIQNGFQQYQQQKADAPRREAEALQLQDMKDQRAAAQAEAEAEKRRDVAFQDLLSREEAPDPREILTIYGPERGSKIAQGLQAFSELANKKVVDARDTTLRLAVGYSQMSPAMRTTLWPSIRSAAITGGLWDEETAPQEPINDADLKGVIGWASGELPEPPKFGQRDPEKDIFNEQTGEVVTPGTPKPEKVTFSAPTPAMVNGRRAFIRAGSDGQMYDASGQVLPPGAASPLEPQGSAAPEPLHAVIGPDGRPVLVPRSQAVGQTPASTREQGRAVTSGDAGRIAEFDTSLDDLKVLGTTLTSAKGATGTASKVGAMLPNAVTEFTGWGEESKQRQAVIDRVKQVIGKALEGGVLRKEDEYKYTKILPTIGDTAAVAAQKLKGLAEAITLRRQRTIEALEDAGYDTGRFKARGAGPAGRIRYDENGNIIKGGG